MELIISLKFDELIFSESKNDIFNNPFTLPHFLKPLFEQKEFDESLFREIEKKLEYFPVKFVRRFNSPNNFSIVKNIEPEFEDNTIFPKNIFIEKRNNFITAEITICNTIRNLDSFYESKRNLFNYIFSNNGDILNSVNKRSLQYKIQKNLNIINNKEAKETLYEKLKDFIYNNETTFVTIDEITSLDPSYSFEITEQHIENVKISLVKDIFIDDYKIDGLYCKNDNGNLIIQELFIIYKEQFQGVLRPDNNHSFSSLVISYLDTDLDLEEDFEKEFTVFNFYVFFKKY